MHHRIYLDHNATTPIDQQVLHAVIEELKLEARNPSSFHYHGQQSKSTLDNARKIVADFMGVKLQEIIFTSGGTEGAFLLIQGVMAKHTTGHVITSNTEHSCVHQNVLKLVEKGVEVTFLPSGSWGAVKAEDVAKAIRPDTRLITLMAANNETGVKTEIEAIASICQRAGIHFVVDGVALLGKESIQWPQGVSAAFFSGHKIHASKGVGFFFCRQTTKLTPLLVGGGQEFNRRAGTENLAGIVGLAEAIKILSKDQSAITAKMTFLRDWLERGLLNLGNVKINGQGPRIANTTNLSFNDVDGETLLIHLDRAGLSVSHGSACSSGALEPSRILINMGLPLKEARSALRFSIGRTTTQQEIEQSIAVVSSVLTKLRGIKK